MNINTLQIFTIKIFEYFEVFTNIFMNILHFLQHTLDARAARDVVYIYVMFSLIKINHPCPDQFPDMAQQHPNSKHFEAHLTLILGLNI